MTEDEVKAMNSEEAVKAMRNAYAQVFSGDTGKLVLKDLSVFCASEDSTVRSKPIDPYDVVYNEGMRRVYLRIKGMIKKGKL
jgi:hypothetical protein